MIQKGCLENVNEIYGLHNFPAGPLGKVYCREGVIMAHLNFFNIKITG
jgi:hippurate hydrolase